MNQFVIAANDFLKNANFEYAICGGFALDLFTDIYMRVHSDIDVCVFEKDKNLIFQYMKDNEWLIYEFQGQGIVRLVREINNCQNGRNLMCLKNDCEIVKFYPCDRGDDYFLHEFYETGITDFNYLEFLFNTQYNNNFIFDENINICRDMSKAIIFRDNVPYLSPELVLLYKSQNIEEKRHQFDYEKTINKMDSERINWFNNSLDILYPNGHIWRK